MHQPKKLDGALAGVAAADAFVIDERLLDLVADREQRIEPGHRLLEDHGDLHAAKPVELRRRPAEDFFAAIADRAGRPAVAGKEAEGSEHGLRLAGAGF